MDQEKHFDESIRRKLKDEDYTPPPFAEILPVKDTNGRSWLRSFLFGDLLILLTCLLWSGASYFNNGTSKDSMEFIASTDVNTSNKNTSSPDQIKTEINNQKVSKENKENIESKESKDNYTSGKSGERSTYSQNSGKSSVNVNKNGPDDIHKSNYSTKHTSSYNIISSQMYSSGLLALNDKSPGNDKGPGKLNETNSELLEENRTQTDYLTPLKMEAPMQRDYTLKSRDFSHSPMEFRSPFSLDVLLIAEKTIGYNREIPEVSKLYLDLKPRDGGYGIGVLFGYHVYKNFGISSGFETVFRKYNLNYSYSSTAMVMQLDSTYKEETVILSNSRTVSETEVRIPLLATFSFTLKKKWSFEPAAGFAIKFKELKADMSEANEIPASILGSIEVSNGHMVTAAWMLSCQTGYMIGENSLLFVTPYYQAESLDKNSRQYYTGRAVSGIGVKTGIKILFNKKADD